MLVIIGKNNSYKAYPLQYFKYINVYKTITTLSRKKKIEICLQEWGAIYKLLEQDYK